MGVRALTILAFALVSGALPALARAEVDFSARVDRTEVGEDESFSLKLMLASEGISRLDGEPKYAAPDFELVSEYPSQNFETVYENGRFSMRSTVAYTFILRPKRRGTFTISQISITAEGTTYRAPNINVRVVAGGAGTPPPRQFGGGGGAGPGLRGGNKAAATGGTPFLIRAEVDHSQAYKGQRIIVSYYLYRRVRIFNIRADKFPTLSGFLREELDMPILQPRAGPDPDQVLLNGVPYERSLLVRYAAYPLREGKLQIDTLAVGLDYFGSRGASPFDDEDNPFAGFFNQMMPQKATASSEMLTVDVLPLPSDGRPASFTGAVGQFEIAAGFDRAEAKTGEPVNFSVRIEGQGNLSAIEPPKPVWPDGSRVVESNARITGGKSGAGQKSFDFTVIFRKPGDAEIAPVEFSYFDPERKQYVVTRTNPQRITVSGAALDDAAGADSAAAAPGKPAPLPSRSAEDARAAILPQIPVGSERSQGIVGWLALEPVLRILAWFLILASCIAAARSFLRRRRASQNRSRSIERTDPRRSWNKAEAELLRLSEESITTERLASALALAESALAEALDARFGLNPRVLSNAALVQALREDREEPDSLVAAVDSALESLQSLRYGSGGDRRTELLALLQAWRAIGPPQAASEDRASGRVMRAKLLDDPDEASIIEGRD